MDLQIALSKMLKKVLKWGNKHRLRMIDHWLDKQQLLIYESFYPSNDALLTYLPKSYHHHQQQIQKIILHCHSIIKKY